MPSTYLLHLVHAWLSGKTDCLRSASNRVGISFPLKKADSILPHSPFARLRHHFHLPAIRSKEGEHSAVGNRQYTN
jgi:hypothetical protein